MWGKGHSYQPHSLLKISIGQGRGPRPIGPPHALKCVWHLGDALVGGRWGLLSSCTQEGCIWQLSDTFGRREGGLVVNCTHLCLYSTLVMLWEEGKGRDCQTGALRWVDKAAQ